MQVNPDIKKEAIYFMFESGKTTEHEETACVDSTEDISSWHISLVMKTRTSVHFWLEECVDDTQMEINAGLQDACT